MKALITVPGVAGNFNVRVVKKGDKYGRDLCLTNTGETLVEFYDARYDFTPLGQFVSRYYLSTLMSPDVYPNSGLSLDLGIPNWTVTAEGMRQVRQALATIH